MNWFRSWGYPGPGLSGRGRLCYEKKAAGTANPVHKLVFASVEKRAPSRVVALGIGVEPARERQANFGESAGGAHAVLGSHYNRA